MKSLLAKRIVMLGAAMFAGGLATHVMSQEPAGSYPSKPISIIFASTGTTSSDTELRLYQNALKSRMTMVFEYKGGASGAIAVNYVSRQKPDGYTYLATASTVLSVPMFVKDIGYDLFRDLEPVTQMSKKNFMIQVHPDAPYRTLKDYIDYARANPTKLNWGTSGEGSSTHLPGMLLHTATGTNVTFVHYKGANDKLIDLMAGRIEVSVGTILASMGYVKAGKMRPIAVTDSERSALLPDLPTVAQSGLPGLSDYEYATWLGLFAPVKTPASLIGKFTDLLKQGSKDPAVIKALYDADTVQVVSSPDQFRTYLVKEQGRLDKTLKAAGVASGK